MKCRVWILLLALAVMLTAATGSAAAQGEGEGTPKAFELRRTYTLYLPSTFDSGEAMPLVFVLHGDMDTSRNMMALTRFNEVAEREGFIVIYPQGYNRSWNYGRQQPGEIINRIDDVGFIEGLIDLLSENFNVDEERIFVTGLSLGGVMAHYLGCQLSDRLAAIAPVAGTVPDNLLDDCPGGDAVSVLYIQGTMDAIMPWDGTEIIIQGQSYGRQLSAPETVDFWLDFNSCATDSVPETVASSSDDYSGVTRTVYGECDNGAQVVFYAIEGGGHNWPHPDWQLPREIANPDLDATELIWEFFAGQSATNEDGE